MAHVLNILYTTRRIQEENSRIFVILPKDFLYKENDWLKIAKLNFIKIKYMFLKDTCWNNKKMSHILCENTYWNKCLKIFLSGIDLYPK